MKLTGKNWIIVDILDTRDFDLVGDAWKPVPGSGDSVACDHCGRLVQIHVHVRRGEERAIVGQTCIRRLQGIVSGSAPVRRPDSFVDALVAVGLDLTTAVRVVAGLRNLAAGLCAPSMTAWAMVHGPKTRELCVALWVNSPAVGELWTRAHAVIREHGFAI